MWQWTSHYLTKEIPKNKRDALMESPAQPFRYASPAGVS